MVMAGLSVVGLVVGLVCWRRGLVGAVLEMRFISSLLGRPERALAALAVEVAVAVAEMDHAEGEALAVGIPDRDWVLAAESLRRWASRPWRCWPATDIPLRCCASTAAPPRTSSCGGLPTHPTHRLGPFGRCGDGPSPPCSRRRRPQRGRHGRAGAMAVT